VEQANVVIIGGGVLGCAIARALSPRWSDVLVLEAVPNIGMGASSRNVTTSWELSLRPVLSMRFRCSRN